MNLSGCCFFMGKAQKSVTVYGLVKTDKYGSFWDSGPISETFSNHVDKTEASIKEVGRFPKEARACFLTKMGFSKCQKIIVKIFLTLLKKESVWGCKV